MTDLHCYKCHKRLGKVKYLVPVEVHDKDNGVNAIGYKGELALVFLCDECAEIDQEEVTDDHPRRLYRDAPAQLPEDHR